MPHARCLIWRKSIKIRRADDRGAYKLKQIGYVTEVLDDTIKVRVDRESSCGGNCVSCKGCPASAVIVECKTNGDIEKGDRVKIVLPNRKFFKNIFLGYGLSIILMVAGAVLGYVIFQSEGASVLGTALGLALGLIMQRLIFRGRSDELIATKCE